MKNWVYIFGLLALSQSGNAQTAATNTGTLYIKSGSDIFYAGSNFTNNAGAALTNNGSLYIKGNLTNDQSSMAAGTGTLYLNGTSTQTINGSQKFKTYNLQTNNSAGITLNNDLSASGVHTFTAGIITTSSTPNYLIYEAGSSYTGDSDSRHVNGWVKKIGSTSFTFPVGDNTYERTIALNFSASSEFNVKYAVPTPNTNISDLNVPLVSIDPNEYWIVNQVSGGAATVAMNWDHPKVAFPNWQLADIRVASFVGSKWMDAGGTATGNTTTQGNITSGSVSSFSRFTFGSVTFPLPLTLVSFSAKYMGSYTALSWTTVDEQNVDHFTVERSDDGNHFYSIVQLPARNSGNREVYTTIDYKTINHIAYYRLLSVDIDGKEKLSRIIPVIVADLDNNLVLLTNPVHDHITLAAGAQLNGSFYYRINMITGQLVQQGNLSIKNWGQYELPLKENFKKGIYTMVVSNNLQSFSYRFVVY
jgi:hypothetical protein